MNKLLVILCLASCSVGTRAVTRKCPVPTTAVLTDFMAGLGLMAIGWIKASEVYSVPGFVLISSAYVSEMTCLMK